MFDFLCIFCRAVKVLNQFSWNHKTHVKHNASIVQLQRFIKLISMKLLENYIFETKKMNSG